MNDSSTSEASPDRLARLLEVGLDSQDQERSDQPPAITGDLLRARLAGTLPLDESVVDALPVILQRPCEELAPLSNKTLGEVLLDSQTDLPATKTLKEYGKTLALRHRSDADHDSAIAIYYAAIASALMFHDQKITQYSYADLASSFEMLIHKPWMVPELDRHFSEARKFCQQKAD